MIRRSMILLALIPAAPVAAQQSKHDRAKAFTLESVTPAPTPTPTPTPTPDASASPAPADTTASALPDAAPAPSPTPGLRASFTLDTPIADLIADPAAKAVLDRDLPGLSTDKNLDKFATLGLRQFQPLTGGQLTDALLVKVARDLAQLSGPMLAPIAPSKNGGSRHNRDASR